MNTYKKILAGLLVTTLLVVAGLVFLPRETLAFTGRSNDQIKNATFTFKNRATITGVFSGAGGGASETITFTDSKPFDNNPNYKPPGGSFCKSGDSVDGITLDNPLNNRTNNITAKVDLDWTEKNIQADCVDTEPDPVPKTIGNPSAAYLVYEWDEQDLISLIASGGLSGTGDPNLFMEDPNDNCGGGVVVILNSGSTSQGTMYFLNPLSGPPAPAPFGDRGCKITGAWPVNISGTRGEPASGEDSTAPLTEDTPSCEKNFSTVFAYILCPALELADSAAEGLFGYVERELCFKTGPDSSTAGEPCQGEALLSDGVKTSWGAFRTIATALLVIIMLVMVMSQAFSIGPFDAYTVRKLLPRILAAVILIQLSWVMLSFFIDLSNDLGRGIADLMFAPFGGADSPNLNLANMLGDEVREATGSKANADAFVFFSALAAGTLLIANLPGLFALAFFAIVAIFVAFAILIIRKLLIIMLVLLAPLALIAWILPAGESYWKSWKDNFTKLLLMFPMIMALIAAGRIMAYIASTSAVMFPPRLAIAHVGPLPVPYFADVSSFVGLAIIVVAFFAPYFLILKTFQWAGGLMAVVARGVSNSKAIQKASEKGGEAARGYTERKVTGWAAKKYDPNKGILSRTGYSVLGGRMIPTKYRQAVLTQRGDEWAKMRNAEAESYIGRGYEKALNGYRKYEMDEDGNYLRGIKKNDNGEMIDDNGNVVKYKKDAAVDYRGKDQMQADFEDVSGVEAGKQFLVDSAGLSGNDAMNRRAQAAHKMLINTHSEIEQQSARIQGGKYDGMRVSEVPIYRDTLENSPEHYSAMIQRRPDFAPDVIESAQSKVKDTYEAAYADTNLASRTARVRKLDTARTQIALERLSPEALGNAHYGFFQDIERMGNEKLTDKQGNEQDTTISEYFGNTLQKFQTQGSVVGQNAVGSLHGGKEQYVVGALNPGKASDDPTRITIKQAASGGGAAVRRQQTAEPEVVLQVQHPAGTVTREKIVQWNDDASVGEFIQRSGGMQALHENDLTAVYEHTTGDLQTKARAELERRRPPGLS